jgi:glutamyl-tRNA synthetase
MKTRFAPSPTGYLHIGNVRTALFCALLAKSKQGGFLLRIEDTDQTRSTQAFADHLQSDLHWLGLSWNEGPYYQSQRQEIYNQYYHQLEDSHHVYPCFCTEQQLAIARKVQISGGQAPRYSGACRQLSPEKVAEKIAQGLKPTLRFRVPDNQEITFTDFVRGEQSFKSNEIGDFIIRRADGTAPFFFCNAIDDALMEVTHVLRGEDHLSNTPRQLMILKTLQLPIPSYGHMALIVGSDGSPLSKRHGSRSITDLREGGYLPLGIVNYLARLGHYYASNDYMTFTQLAEGFSTELLGRSSARFDQGQLLYWQKQAAIHLSPEEAWQWFGEAVNALVPPQKKELFIKAVQGNVVFPANALHWAQMLFQEPLVYGLEGAPIIKQAGANFFEKALELLLSHQENFKTFSQALQEVLNIKGKAFFQPLRIALCGQLDGPELLHVFELLGVEKIRSRFQQAQKLTK